MLSETRLALTRCLSPLETVRVSDERTLLRGTIEAGAMLAGPPGRLHGGLHPAVRLLLPHERLVGPRPSGASSVRLELGVRRGITLAGPVPIEGRLEVAPDGSALLATRVDGTERLDGTLATVDDDGAIEALAHFAPLLDAYRAAPKRTIVGHGNLRVEVGERLVTLAITPEWVRDTSVDLVRFLGRGGRVDPVFACVALDVIGAYAQGMNLDTRLYTTHLSLVVGGEAEVRGEGCWLLGDRQGSDVEASTIAPVDVRGRWVGEQRISVLLADASLRRAYGYGTVTLVPIRNG